MFKGNNKDTRSIDVALVFLLLTLSRETSTGFPSNALVTSYMSFIWPHFEYDDVSQG